MQHQALNITYIIININRKVELNAAHISYQILNIICINTYIRRKIKLNAAHISYFFIKH